MMMLRFLAAAGLLAGGWRTVSAAATGTVFDDRNGNGLREAGEPGLPGVAVSNGVEVVLTDAAGRYTLPSRPGTAVFVIKPAGWQPPRTGQNLPLFYARPSAGAAADFPLRPATEPDDFRALIFTDVQPASPRDVGYLDRTIVDHLAGRRDFAFGVTLGDVTSDRPDLYPAINASLGRIGVPWYNVIGNHDLNLLSGGGDRGSAATFEAAYGPSTFAFRWGQALFIGLNDVRYLGGPRYIGGLRPDQFEFLQNLLRTTPPDLLVVVLLHIPLFSPDPSNAETFRLADRARLFSLLQDRPHVLILSGHTHYQRHVFYGPADGWPGAAPLHEYNVAAACGSFWGGPADADGIPIATMADGTPHGYGVLTCRGTAVQLDYVAARHPADFQLALHVPAAVAPRQAYVPFFANVFNGHDGWTVEARVDDRAWVPLRRTLAWDPSYAALYLAQDEFSRPLATPRLPDPFICYHVWRAYLPTDLAVGSHRVVVRATPPGGPPYRAEQAFLVAAP
jgi:C terminal of Calcineurin-like phosphoesterase/N terminal of Calcineurin-like phosphoesterase/Calcineurin-like phosphoesterase